MRRIGVGTLGLVAGFFVAFLITDLAAGALRPGGGDPPVVVGLLLGYLPLLCAVLGAVAALVIDTAMTKRAVARRAPPAADPDGSG